MDYKWIYVRPYCTPTLLIWEKKQTNKQTNKQNKTKENKNKQTNKTKQKKMRTDRDNIQTCSPLISRRSIIRILE